MTETELRLMEAENRVTARRRIMERKEGVVKGEINWTEWLTEMRRHGRLIESEYITAARQSAKESLLQAKLDCEMNGK